MKMKVSQHILDAFEEDRFKQVYDENVILHGAVDYWQRTALEHRELLKEILADTPHQHVKTQISTHLKIYEDDTETTLADFD